jgi:CheY-like chemotaxis protein
MNKVRVAAVLLMISLCLLIIYGIDVSLAGVASSAVESQESGFFLPLSASTRGSVFGGGAVIMSIIAFAIARNAFSIAIPVLLFVNGGLIITGMAVLIAQGALAASSAAATGTALRTISFTIATGGILVGLAVWKVITNAKIVEGKKTPLSSTSSSKIRILVVDDEPDILLTLNAVLSRHGHYVKTFDNPEKALSHLTSNNNGVITPHYDLVITDYRMPGSNMSGLDLAKRVKEYNTRTGRKTKVFLMSGSFNESSLPEEFIQALKSGIVNKFIQKPIPNDKLIAIVEYNYYK